MNPIVDESVVTETRVAGRAENPSGSPIVPHLSSQAEPKKSLLGRLMKAFMLTVLLIGGAIFGMYKLHVNIPALGTPKIYSFIDDVVVRGEQIKGRVVGQYEAYFHKPEAEAHHEAHKILITNPMAKDVVITQDYVCQIHSQRHIESRALDDGYLEAIPINEGQAVNTGDLMFRVVPILYKAELAAEVAERDYAKMELNLSSGLANKGGVSQKEVLLFEAKLAKAQAKVDLAEARLNFTAVKAPFDGIVGRLKEQQGSLVKEGDVLTTLSDNKVMWVYFNVTEKRYLEYMAETGQNGQSLDVELVLANQEKFPQVGKIDLAHNIGAIEANFNNETGNIAFRADFQNPVGPAGRLLRNGQTGKVLIRRALKDAIVIPQRATFENLAKRYVYVVDKDDVVHQREIQIRNEQDDIYVIEKGLTVADRIIFEGIRQVRDGEKVEFEVVKPEEVMANQKNHAE